MASFRDHLKEDDQARIDALRAIIRNEDKAIAEREGAMMSAKDALLYEEDSVMKYALAQTKSGFTFHSMVMYANPDIFALAKDLAGVKPQKGCLNIADLAKLDAPAFTEMLRASAAKDFSPVIAHYKRKQKSKA